ncbi:MAG: DUF4280 domain-containing protein [Lachnospiraceae bacterium]|jgi:hypothetical protein|nr:DUF4280 domain-containing protein [Lachnospiraceae bacterium]
MAGRYEGNYSQGTERAKEEARQAAAETKQLELTEAELDKAWNERIKQNQFLPEYLVDGALLTCTNCTTEQVLGIKETFSAPPGSDRSRLNVTRNTISRAGIQYFATVKECERFVNIRPFGNCKSRADRDFEEAKIKQVEENLGSNPPESLAPIKTGTCQYLMNLEDEWENLKSYGEYVYIDGERVDKITMEAVLFCKHGGFIYPVDSGFIPHVGGVRVWDSIIPEEVVATVNGVTYTFYPLDNWGGVGGGKYPPGVQRDAEGRYKIAVGPKILNPAYPDNGLLWGSDFEGFSDKIDIVLSNKQTDEVKIIECVVVDIKAHSYNSYPDGQSYITGDIARMDFESGLLQTGIAYPESSNASQNMAFSQSHMNGTIVEFCGHAVDFDLSEYRLNDIIIVD